MGYKDISKLIESIIEQKYQYCEILILRNGLCNIKNKSKRKTGNITYSKSDVFIKEVFIRKKGKGNALNKGIELSKGNIIAVVDADCILSNDALKRAVKHFENEDVVAVGGMLHTTNNNGTLLERIQCFEYIKSFQFARRIFARINGQCIISGAFGLFRKSELIKIGGYDINTVGEDMEIVLRLQDEGIKRSNKIIVYETNAICETKVPYKLNRLFHQRDRWQRGLLDCIIKHKNMVFNPHYGVLGVFTLSYQIWFELFKPIFIILRYIFTVYLLINHFYLILFYWLLTIISIEFIVSFIAEYFELDKNIWKLIKKIPYILVMIIVMLIYQIPIAFARLYGMITFHFRKMVW